MSINTFKEDEVLKDVFDIRIMLRLAGYLRGYTGEVIKTLVLMPIVISVSLLNPYFMKLGIDNYIASKDIKGLMILGVLALLINLVGMFCYKTTIVTMSEVASKILLTIRQELFNHIQGLSFSFFDSRPVGKVLARIIGDVNSLNQLFIDSVTVLIPDAITLITIAIIMLSINYKLALMALIMLPLLACAMFFIQNSCRKRWQAYRKKSSNLNAFIHEAYSGIRVVQSFTQEAKTSSSFSQLSSSLADSFLRAVKMADGFWPIVELSWGIGSAVVFWYGVRLLRAEGISIGVLVAFTGYIGLFWRPIMKLSNYYNILITNMAGAERIFEILDITPEIVDSTKAIQLPPINGAVTFEKVTFSYDSGETVLKNVSFQVKPGETIALVGQTGAGKTTIVNLISRFYETIEGRVLIDGYDIKEVSLESLRKQMTIMTQDSFLFSGSIKDNIRYGKLEATDEEIIEAAKAVQAHNFIMSLEKGYDTGVNERGTRLSVGQRQLIALARAIIAKPRLLILDEATSSIDTETEVLVQKAIDQLLAGRTSFVIAHRLSTIRNADRIMVVEDGEIKEFGNHAELLELKGIYYNLYNAQYKYLKKS